MPRVYELPTHLQVEDHLIAGLTARQLVRLMISASLAYGVWDQATWLAPAPRLAFAAVLACTGLVFALVQPAGRSLDQWLLAGALFLALPRRLVWQRAPALARHPIGDQSGWAELAPRPGWLGSDSFEPADLAPEAVHAHRFPFRWRRGT